MIWKDNKIEEESLRKYLQAFGEIFFRKIVEMIDEAMIAEHEKDKLVNETYFKLGLIREHNFDSITSRQRPSAMERAIGSAGSKSALGPPVALSALAKMRAVLVLPVPRGPTSR